MDRSLGNNMGPNSNLKASFNNISFSNNFVNNHPKNVNSENIDNVPHLNMDQEYFQPPIDPEFCFSQNVPPQPSPFQVPPPAVPLYTSSIDPPLMQIRPPQSFLPPLAQPDLLSLQHGPPSFQAPPSIQSGPLPFQNAPPPIQNAPPPIQNAPPPIQSGPLTFHNNHPSIQRGPLPFQSVPPPDTRFPAAMDFSVPPPIPVDGINVCVDYLPSKVPHSLPCSTGHPDEEKQIQLLINKLNARLISPPIIKQTTTSISKYRKLLQELLLDIKELERLYNRLSILHKSLTDEDWVLRLKEAELQKLKVLEGLESVKKIPVEGILNLIKKRKSKRLRLKRKRVENQLKKKEKVAHCQAEHARINMWLDQMNQQTERIRREEEVKREADLVLSNVRQKKSEAKNMLSLLTTLGKLRNARIKNREARGEFVSKEAAETFNKIIDKLKKMWLDQIKDYNLEEQGLKVMLNDGEVKRTNIKQSLNKQILQQWSQILFGESKESKSYLPTDIDQLISVRRCWDAYSSKGEDASQIPNGWIVPLPPSSDEWKKYLTKKN